MTDIQRVEVPHRIYEVTVVSQKVTFQALVIVPTIVLMMLMMLILILKDILTHPNCFDTKDRVVEL